MITVHLENDQSRRLFSMDDRERCIYIHCPIAFVLDRIEEKFFFASFDRMGRTYTHVIDPTIFLVRKEAIFDTFEWFTMDELQNGDNYETTIDRFKPGRRHLRVIIKENKRRSDWIGMTKADYSWCSWSEEHSHCSLWTWSWIMSC